MTEKTDRATENSTDKPPPNPELFRWTVVWILAALAWTGATMFFVLYVERLREWLVLGKAARYFVVGTAILTVVWPTLRDWADEQESRFVLLLLSTGLGVFAASLWTLLTTLPFLTLIGLASGAFLLMVIVGFFVPIKMETIRDKLKYVRDVMELSLAGLAFIPGDSWLSPALIMVAIAATMIAVGDQTQLLQEKAQTIRTRDIQREATQRAISFYLAHFRLYLLIAHLRHPPRRKR